MINDLEIAISYETIEQQSTAQALANKLHLPLVRDEHYSIDLLLVVTAQRLELRQTFKDAPGPIFVNFMTGKTAYRSTPQNLKNEFIARAIQVKGQPQLHIIDATAGFGQDAFIAASLGHEVQLIERNPIIAALLQDGLERLKAHAASIKLSLVAIDAIAYLQQLSVDRYPDVIYLDPMFPERTKSALVKKEMRLLQQLVGQDLDAPQLLSIARAIAKHKVVVKRPRLAPYIGDITPSFSLEGKVGRFDIYRRQNKI